MPIGWVAAAGAVAGLAGSAMQADAATSAAETQANATRQSQERLQQNYEQLKPYWTPYIETGTTGLNQIASSLPYITQQFGTYKPATTADIMAQLPANYEFMKQQGLGAVRQGLNVQGGGSNMTRAATKFAENYASNAYQNALANYMGQQSQQFNQQTAQRQNIFSNLANIANIGQSGITGLSNLATGNATNIAQLGVQGANATAAGQIGQANAIAGGLSNAAGYGSLYGLSQMRGNQSGGNSLANTYATGDTTVQGPMYQSMLSQGATLNADGTLSY